MNKKLKINLEYKTILILEKKYLLKALKATSTTNLIMAQLSYQGLTFSIRIRLLSLLQDVISSFICPKLDYNSKSLNQF